MHSQMTPEIEEVAKKEYPNIPSRAAIVFYSRDTRGTEFNPLVDRKVMLCDYVNPKVVVHCGVNFYGQIVDDAKFRGYHNVEAMDAPLSYFRAISYRCRSLVKSAKFRVTADYLYEAYRRTNWCDVATDDFVRLYAEIHNLQALVWEKRMELLSYTPAMLSHHLPKSVHVNYKEYNKHGEVVKVEKKGLSIRKHFYYRSLAYINHMTDNNSKDISSKIRTGAMLNTLDVKEVLASRHYFDCEPKNPVRMVAGFSFDGVPLQVISHLRPYGEKLYEVSGPFRPDVAAKLNNAMLRYGKYIYKNLSTERNNIELVGKDAVLWGKKLFTLERAQKYIDAAIKSLCRIGAEANSNFIHPETLMKTDAPKFSYDLIKDKKIGSVKIDDRITYHVGLDNYFRVRTEMLYDRRPDAWERLQGIGCPYTVKDGALDMPELMVYN